MPINNPIQTRTCLWGTDMFLWDMEFLSNSISIKPPSVEEKTKTPILPTPKEILQNQRRALRMLLNYHSCFSPADRVYRSFFREPKIFRTRGRTTVYLVCEKDVEAKITPNYVFIRDGLYTDILVKAYSDTGKKIRIMKTPEEKSMLDMSNRHVYYTYYSGVGTTPKDLPPKADANKKRPSLYMRF